jgi:hypothetical protein
MPIRQTSTTQTFIRKTTTVFPAKNRTKSLRQANNLENEEACSPSPLLNQSFTPKMEFF